MKSLSAVTILGLCVLALCSFAPTQTKPARETATTSPTSASAYPLWNGKESVADYAKRVGIKDTEISLDLGNKVTMKLVLIPAGKFMMGSPEGEEGHDKCEGKQHEVMISRPFYMGIYEVTQAQYEQFVTLKRRNWGHPKGAELPVVSVSWNDATGFCVDLSKKAQMVVRLPTEAEWEYACRAGTTGPFNTGETISSDQANYAGDFAYGKGKIGTSRDDVMRVGSFKPNAWSLYDMHGNVAEWCADLFDPNGYPATKVTDPKGPSLLASEDSNDVWLNRVVRGGCYGIRPERCRSAARRSLSQGSMEPDQGFRIVAELK